MVTDPLPSASHYLSSAIYHIGQPNKVPDAVDCLDKAIASLVVAAKEYPGDRTIRACGRIVRRLRALRLTRASAMILEDVNIILVDVRVRREEC